MQKGLTVSDRYRLQLDAIVAGTQRPRLGIEPDIQVLRRRRAEALSKFEGIGFFDGLGGFLANVDRQDGVRLVAGGTTVFGVDMEDHYVTPVPRVVECLTDRVKRVIDQGVDIACRVVGRFGRVEDERSLERVLVQSLAQRRVFGQERGSTGLRVRYGGRG